MSMFTTNISKRCLWRLINKKIKRLIHNYHVFSIISILFEEIIKDLIDGKSLKIHNFGTLELVKTKSRKYHDVRFKKIMQSNGHMIMKFSLARKIKKKMCANLDINRTFKNE